SWIVTQTSRFKAASTGASVNDLVQEYYLSDAGDFIVEYFGLPWETGELLAAHSPITYVKNVETPLLIQHGENDHRVPLSQAQATPETLTSKPADQHPSFHPRVARVFAGRGRRVSGSEQGGRPQQKSGTAGTPRGDCRIHVAPAVPR